MYQPSSAPRQEPETTTPEPNKSLADLLELILTDEGYRVVLAGNGRQGLERLADGPLPDQVICDYMTPVLNGAGLILAMQANEA